MRWALALGVGLGLLVPRAASAQAPAPTLELQAPVVVQGGLDPGVVAAAARARSGRLATCLTEAVVAAPWLRLAVSWGGVARAVGGTFDLDCASAAFSDLELGPSDQRRFARLSFALGPAPPGTARSTELRSQAGDGAAHWPPVLGGAELDGNPAPWPGRPGRDSTLTNVIGVFAAVTLLGLGLLATSLAVDDPGARDALLISGGILAGPGIIVVLGYGGLFILAKSQR